MPADDSANSRPTNSSSERIALAAILRMDRSMDSRRSSRASMAAETHSASTSTSAAVRLPSMRLRSVSLTVPNFQPMSSSSSRMTGSSPVTHSTAPSQMTQEPMRSTSRIGAESGQAAASTRATTRMKASDTSSGSASLNSAGDSSHNGSSRRAPKASASASSGNSAPSMTRRPNSTLASRRVIARDSAQLSRAASARQASSRAHSPSAAGLNTRLSRACSSVRLRGWCIEFMAAPRPVSTPAGPRKACRPAGGGAALGAQPPRG